MTFSLTCSEYVCVCACCECVNFEYTKLTYLYSVPKFEILEYLPLSPMTSKTDLFKRYPELNIIAVYIISF